MANISLQVNTDGPSLTVSIDGQSVPNVDSINVYRYREEDDTTEYVEIAIYTREVMKNGVMKVVNYYAAGTREADAAIASQIPLDTETIPGFVGIEKTEANPKARQDIQAFFNAKRR